MNKRNAIPSDEFAAAANSKTIAKTDVEKRVVKCWGVLERAESSFKPGLEFGRAVIELRNEIKKEKYWMARLKELHIPYAKARYWIAIVEGKPINRGKAKKDALTTNTSTPGRSGTPTIEWRETDWRDDWDAATRKFHEAADAISMLAQAQAEGTDAYIEEFVGELENLAEVLGYELKKKGTTNDLLQREQPADGIVAESAHAEGADRMGDSR